MYVIACAFRWGVVLLGEFFYWALLTPLWDPLSDTGGVQKTTLRRGLDYEGDRLCGLDITFVKGILYKRIVTKFF